MHHTLQTILTLSFLVAATSPSIGAVRQSSDDRGAPPPAYADTIPTAIKAGRTAQKPQSGGKKSTVPKRTKAVRYVPATADSAPIKSGVNLGVTFWLLRASQPSDPAESKTRLAIREEGKTAEITAERADASTVFSDGEMMQMSFELPIRGYVYIIDREQYADGTTSDPYLIFPSEKDRGTNDVGSPGKLTVVPSADDYFRFKRTSEKPRTAELFTVVVSRSPIAEFAPLKPGEQARVLDRSRFEQSLEAWSTRTVRFDQTSKPATITRVERDAESGGLLGTGDPLPQTVFATEARYGSPLCVTVPVLIRSEK